MMSTSDPFNTPPSNDNKGGLPSFPIGAGHNEPPIPGAKPEPPSSILNAVRLMFVGAGLSALGFIIALTSIDSVREQIAEDNPEYSASEIDTAVNVGLAIGIGAGLIGVGLWIWMALMNKRGLSWARIVASVLGGINVLFSVFGLGAGGLSSVLALANLGLAAVIIWFLFRPESSQYYDAVSASRHP